MGRGRFVPNIFLTGIANEAAMTNNHISGDGSPQLGNTEATMARGAARVAFAVSSATYMSGGVNVVRTWQY